MATGDWELRTGDWGLGTRESMGARGEVGVSLSAALLRLLCPVHNSQYFDSLSYGTLRVASPEEYDCAYGKSPIPYFIKSSERKILSSVLKELKFC